MKTCPRCKIEKAKRKFHRDKRTKSGLKSECKECGKKANRLWRKENREKCNKRMSHWRKENRFALALITSRADAKRYGGYFPCNATKEEIEVAFTGFCHICGTAEKENDKKLCLEHSHKNGIFRGWVCDSCNTGLNKFKDSSKILSAALQYLKKAEKKHCNRPLSGQLQFQFTDELVLSRGFHSGGKPSTIRAE